MREWLRKCSTEYKFFAGDDIHRLPTRILGVGSDSEPPCLVTSRGRFGKWVALGHCWGRQLPIKTEQAILRSRCEEIPVTALGPTFKDSMLITRALGIKYLWIDALCIIQDSESDWRTESATMNYVYQNASLTIAAEASSGSNIGICRSMMDCRRPESTLRYATCHSTANNLQGRLLFRQREELWTSRGPLSTRAWKMQEEILSPRILRFSRQQVMWRCNSDNRSREWYPEGDAKIFPPYFLQSLRDLIRRFPEPEPDHEILASGAMKESLISF